MPSDGHHDECTQSLYDCSSAQNGLTADMMTKADVLVQYVVEHFPVVAGDLILTGAQPAPACT